MSELKSFPFESDEKFLRRLNYELEGRSFHVVMDNGEDRLYSFATGECVSWGLIGQPMRWNQYKCLKADSTTYMVAIELLDTPYRTCSTLVLDLDNSLATEVYTQVGRVPDMPRMAMVEYRFGAIKQNGEPLPRKRHGYTSDLVGMKLNWYYSTGFVNTHIYYSDMYYRCKAFYVPDAVQDTIAREMLTKPDKNEGVDENFVDDEARYIRIKDGIYLISFMEDNINRNDPLRGGSNLLILVNLKEGFNVGRSFTYNRSQQPEYAMFKAYCDPTDVDTGLENLPSPYRI